MDTMIMLIARSVFLNTQDTFIDKINQQTEHFILNNLQLPGNQIFK